MTTKTVRTRKTAERVRMGGQDYVLLPASEYPRVRGTGRKVVFDAIEVVSWSIGRDLRRLRRKAGLSQAEVAARAKIRAETLSRLENGRGNPTVATLRRILQALGATENS